MSKAGKGAGAGKATVGRPKGTTVGRVPAGNFTFQGSAASPRAAAAGAKAPGRKVGGPAFRTLTPKTTVGRKKK